MFGAILGAAGGIAKGVMGAIQASKARKAIANYKRQDLENVYEGVSVSTKAQEYAQQQLAQSGATAMQDLKAGGVRGVVGATSKIVSGSVDSAAKIGAEIDAQMIELQNKKAADEVRIQGVQEEREKADLAGLGQQLAVGQQNLFSGIGDVAQAASAGLADFGGFTPQVKSVSESLTPQSVAFTAQKPQGLFGKLNFNR